MIDCSDWVFYSLTLLIRTEDAYLVRRISPQQYAARSIGPRRGSPLNPSREVDGNSVQQNLCPCTALSLLSWNAKMRF
jgi:hypothetical protein